MLTDVAGRERLGREREFWDRLYRDRAKEHKDTFAERYVHKSAYSRKVLHSRLGGLRHMKILSIGGGVDRLAVHLAQLENTVVTVYLSGFRLSLGIVRRSVSRVSSTWSCANGPFTI
jgi:2-polyprenyl-3-methyl-5-hydroxy-6-metoxy-1,4-benzoquinol methylase